jgi:protoporphyrinogen oxidase
MMRLVSATGSRHASWFNILGAFNSWSAPLLNVLGGLDQLTEALAEKLDLHCEAEVTSVHEAGDQVTVTYTDGCGATQVLEADTCVITAMYHIASRIWPPLRECSPEFDEQLRSAKLISVSLGYRVRAKTRAYVVQVPTVESADGLLVFMQHNKAPDRAPTGHSLVTIYTDTTATDSYLTKSDDEIEAWAAGLIETWCPELAGHRDLAVVTRWPKAGYSPDPGFWRRSADLLDALPADGRVHVAGDLFGAGSMESAVRWGERAAQRVVNLPATHPVTETTKGLTR